MIGICEDLRKSVLQAAIQGRLTKQLPEDGDAEDLYKEIQAEKQRLIREGKIKKDKPLPEITENDIPFDIPENWKWVRLKEIVYNNGQITPFEDFSYIDIGSIDNIHQKLNQMENIIEPNKAPSRARKIVTQGDILYSTVRPYLHNMCIVDKTFSHTPIASTGFAVMSCFNGIYNRFLFYYLLSPDFDAYANAIDNAKGVAYPAINDDKLYKAIVPLPPLAEQKRIVARVNELMKRIDGMEKTEKDITALYDAFPGDMKAALLQAAIQGKLTKQLTSDGDAEALYQEIQAEKQRLIKEGKIKKEKPLPEITDDDIPFDIPENWKWVHLCDVGYTQTGNTPPTKSPEYYGNDIPFIGPGDILLNGLINYSHNAISFLGKDVARIAIEGTILQVCIGGSIGKSAITLKDIAFNQQINSITPILCYSSYLHAVINSSYFKSMLIDNSGGTATPIINRGFWDKMPFPLPPLAEQKRIIEKLDQLLPLCDSMKEAIDATA